MSSGDQASRLRQLFKGQAARQPSASAGPARVIAISSGKGGVGKTNISANLSIALAGLGSRIALLDADYALANVDILLGFSPQFTLEHVLDGQRNVGEIIVDGPGGIKVVPASSGVQHLTSMAGSQKEILFNSLKLLERHFDSLVIDTAAGMGEDVVTMLQAAGEVVVVTNPEPPAFVDSYALIKHLINKQFPTRIRILVNQVANENEARAVYDRIERTVEKFLDSGVEYLGYIPEDIHVKKAVRQRKPFVMLYPNCPASRSIRSLAQRILREPASQHKTGFWNSLKNALAG